jgi:hypothetical protein
MTDTVARIHLDHIDVPDDIPEHARTVITLWFGFAREAWLKGDHGEAARLHQLVRQKINYEMSKSRCGGDC